MRNFFDKSFEHKLTTDGGYLVPIMCEDVLPGDTSILSTRLLSRVAPLANPIMHNVTIRVHHWYVPNRILWDGWEDFITGKDDTTPKPTAPNPSGVEETFLADHMGIDPRDVGSWDALPFRAYNLIWNEFYRDQDLQTERDLDDLTLARICWEKDYFTVARPQPQQGDPVAIEFSAGEVPVRGFGHNSTLGTGTITDPIDKVTTIPNADTRDAFIRIDDEGPVSGSRVWADMANATGGIDVNDFRRAIALQRFAEARMRFGERYVDYLRFLGVNPSDGRLDRPEYLGGGRQRVNFSEVLATAEGASTEVGDMYGHGIAGLRTNRIRKAFEEHGWVLSLLSIRPKTVYQNQVPRRFTRETAMDYWQKELEVLPWQEVKTREVHYNGNDTDTWGYVPRYDEYRHSQSYVSGQFRSGVGTMDDWHMGRDFASPPALNGSFVECTPTDRIYQDTNMAEFIINARVNHAMKRLIRANAAI